MLRRLLVVLALGVLLVLLAGPWLIGRMAGTRLTAAAKQRGLAAQWERASGGWPAKVRFDRLLLRREATGDTLLRADSVFLALDPASVLFLRPRPGSVRLAGASIRISSSGAGVDTTLEEGTAPPVDRGAARRSAEALVRVLGFQPRRLPRIDLRDVTIATPPGADLLWSGAHIERLELRPVKGDLRLEARGSLRGEREIPFEASLDYAKDDRLRGDARVGIPTEDAAQELRIRVDGVLTHDAGRGTMSLSDSTRIWVGEIPLRVGGRVSRDGPRLELRTAADGLTDRRVKSSIPAALLGPLLDVGVRGSWDHRLTLDLDLARPDSVRFDADVIPHGLSIDPGRTRLMLLGLEQPFVAQIHLPRGRDTARELTVANPFYRPLFAMSPVLVAAVVTNEDGSFFRHRGFNLEAVREAITENVEAGAFRRGAGTITMQLARNLFLGHQRTLARKFHEVVLAWLLENETGLSKERLLEIYLNIIEWGPGVHGAGEAARYYFERDPLNLTVDEALFLATVVPAPLRWKRRFDATGQLRPWARAQMHFIGRAMIRKGWLAPEDLPPSDSLRVDLRGIARLVLEPPPQ
jgi:hypothetical protein